MYLFNIRKFDTLYNKNNNKLVKTQNNNKNLGTEKLKTIKCFLFKSYSINNSQKIENKNL